MPTFALQPGEPYNLMDADAAAAPVNGAAVAMPGDFAKVISWGTTFASAPSAASVKLQVSMDGTSWIDLDTSTLTTGDAKTTSVTNARFIRARKESQTGGGALTVVARMGYS